MQRARQIRVRGGRIGWLSGRHILSGTKTHASPRLFALELASELQLKNQTLVDRLDELLSSIWLLPRDPVRSDLSGSTRKRRDFSDDAGIREKSPGKLGPVVLNTAQVPYSMK